MMDREEILRRAQSEQKNKKDEMQEYIEKSGYQYSVVFGGAACLILMIAKIAAGVSWYDVYCIWAVMAGASHLYSWKKTKAKSCFLLSIAWLAVGFLFGLCYMLKIL